MAQVLQKTQYLQNITCVPKATILHIIPFLYRSSWCHGCSLCKLTIQQPLSEDCPRGHKDPRIPQNGTFLKNSDTPPPPYGGTDSDTLNFCCRNLWSLHPMGSKFCRLLWKYILTGPALEVTIHRGGSDFFEMSQYPYPRPPRVLAVVDDQKDCGLSGWGHDHYWLCVLPAPIWWVI